MGHYVSACFLLMLGASGSLAQVACANPITISEAGFTPGAFVTQQITGGLGGGASLTQTGAGNPGNAGVVNLSVTPGPPANGLGSWSWLACFSTQRTFDPTAIGAIASIDCSLDSAWIGGSVGPTVQSNALVVRQNGKVYYAPLPLTSLGGWVTANTNGITSGVFQEIISVGDQFLNPASHPDFSASGEPIEVGFARGNSNGGGSNFAGYSNSVGADNFIATVHLCINVTGQPASASTCTIGAADFEVAAAGDGTLSYRWQAADPTASGGWIDIADGTLTIAGRDVGEFSGAATNRGRWNGQYRSGHAPGPWAGSFRCVVSNSCGSANSDPALLRICFADLNCDGVVDDSDFVVFASAYNTLLCDDPSISPPCLADLNGDEFVDDSDFVLFAPAYDTLLCP
ncbi:MAG: hypothetical protein KF805_04165 [Phycisphaeraceae bacterium]|nr:hypothetical protein [Phycisphaeraceae bacterium]